MRFTSENAIVLRALAIACLFLPSAALAQNAPPDAVDDTFQVSGSTAIGSRQILSAAPLVGPPDTTALTSVTALTAWDEGGDILGQTAIGTSVGPVFTLNSTTTGTQSFVRLATLSNGNVVATWMDDSGTDDAASTGIRARLFDAFQQPLGPDFAVNTTTAGAQSWPAVASLTGGGFVIVWEDASATGGDSMGSAIRGQRFDAAGIAQGAEILINDIVAGDQIRPDVTGLADGGFAASWAEGVAFHARLFDNTGSASGASFRINDGHDLENTVFPPRLAGLNGGGLAAAWDAGYIHARRFDASGTPQGAAFRVDSTDDDQGIADVSPLANGGFAVAWASNNIVPTVPGARPQFDNQLRARFYDGGGNYLTFWNSGATFGNKTTASIAPQPGGGVYAVTRLGVSGFADPESHAFTVSLVDSPYIVGVNSVDPLANDTDSESQPLSITAFNGQAIPGAADTVTLPSGAVVSRNLTLPGRVLHNTEGVPPFVALPVGQFVDDSFTYTITDGSQTDTASVSIRINGRNDAPTAVDDAISFNEDEGSRNVAPEILANDIEPDAGEQHLLSVWSLGFTSNGGQLSGTLPEVIYTPPASANALAQGESLTDTFAYLVRDPYTTTSSQGIVTVTVNGANDLPSLAAISASTDEATPLDLTAAILAQVSDSDTNDVHTVTSIDTAGTRGAVTLNAGVLTYDPNGTFDVLGTGESGTDSFGVTIADPQGATASAVVTVTVNGSGAANQPPDAVDDALSVRALGLQPGDTSDIATAGGAQQPAITGFSGGLIAVWSDGNVQGRRLMESAAPDGPAVQLSDQASGTQDQPDVAALLGGGFVATWRDDSGTGGDVSSTSIRARRFNADGLPAGASFLVNTTTSGAQSEPAIAATADGGFVVVWTDASASGGDTSGLAVRGQRYNAAAVAQGAEFLANGFSLNDQDQPDVAGLLTGAFVITWRDQRGSDADIWARSFAADGTPAGADFAVNTALAFEQRNPAISLLNDGGFLIAWRSAEQRIHARRYTAAGAPAGGQFFADNGQLSGDLPPTLPIPTTFSERLYPVVTGTDDGGYAIGWIDHTTTSAPPAGTFISWQLIVVSYAPDNSLTRFRQFGRVTNSNAAAISSPGLAPVSQGGFAGIWSEAPSTVAARALAPASEPFRANRVEALDVLANDTDPESQPLSITQINGTDLGASEVRTLASGATLQRSANRLNYDPRNAPFAIALPAGVTGTDSFAYTASDGFLTDTATVTVTLTGVNNGPVANPDQLSFGEDEAVRSVVADVLANDTDPDTGETALLAIYQKTNATNGGIVFGGQGELFYGPNGGFEQLAAGQTAQDSFTYSIIDPQGFFTIVAVPVTVTINGANDAPDAGSINAATAKNSSINVTSFIQQAATDPDTGDTLTITGVGSTGTAGMVSLVNGDVVYDPAGAFPGLGTGQTAQDSFTYTVRDAQGAEDTGTATITVNGGPNTLTVSLDGLGSGQVGSTPGGIACGNGLNACVSSFAAGSTVTLNASALTGSTFAGWVTGPCAGQTGSCAVPMSSDRNIIARFETDTTVPTPVYLATLPNARGGSVGGPDITAFATAVSGGEAVQGCTISIAAGAPVGFAYQRLDAGNTPIGPLNPEFDIPQNGAVGFVLAMTPNQATGPDGYLMQPQLTCENATADPIEGANSVLLSISATPGPDILSVSATASGDGIIRIPAIGRTGLMVAAAVNIGSGPAPVTARVDTGAAQLPVTLQVCETDAAGNCLAPRASEVATNIGGAPAFFAVFARGDGPVALDPANARVFLRFVDAGGVTQSATSAAVTVPAPASAAPALAGLYSVLVRQEAGVWPSLVRASLYVSDQGWAVLDDGVRPRQLPVSGTLNEGVTIAGMAARFRADGFIRAGNLAMNDAGSFWGVRDVRSDIAPDWPELAGIYAGTAQLTASGELQGSLAGCQLTGESLPPGEAAGLRLINVQLTGCDASGSYRGSLDIPANGVPVLIVAGETEGWSAVRE